jgi:phytol kinase
LNRGYHQQHKQGGYKVNPIPATLITFAVAVGFLRLMDFFAHRGWIESRMSRKLIHIGTGPVFVLCWLLYADRPEARWLAALVPLMIVAQFALVGMGILKDEAAVQAMSRTGNPREILRGPLFYGIAFVVLTVLFWKDSPVGMTALMMMCGGDGLADIVGRRVSSPRLAWSREKSLAGTLSVFVGGWLLSALVLFIYVMAGVFQGPFSMYLLPVTIVAIVGTAVESLPFRDIDNITLTLAAVLMGMLVF